MTALIRSGNVFSEEGAIESDLEERAVGERSLLTAPLFENTPIQKRRTTEREGDDQRRRRREEREDKGREEREEKGRGKGINRPSPLPIIHFIH